MAASPTFVVLRILQILIALVFLAILAALTHWFQIVWLRSDDADLKFVKLGLFTAAFTAILANITLVTNRLARIASRRSSTQFFVFNLIVDAILFSLWLASRLVRRHHPIVPGTHENDSYKSGQARFAIYEMDHVNNVFMVTEIVLFFCTFMCQLAQWHERKHEVPKAFKEDVDQST